MKVVRREMRKLKGGMRQIPFEHIREMIEQEVIKRELLGEDGEDAKKLIAKASRKQRKATTRKTTESVDKSIAGYTSDDEDSIDTGEQDD